MPDGYRLTDDDRLTSAERRKRDAAQTPIVLYGTPSIEELAAARGRAGSRGVLVVPEEMRNEGLLVGVFDQEEHTHYTDRATRLCAEGDHDSAELWDRDAERIKVREHEAAEQDRIMREDGIVDITRHTEATIGKVYSAFEAIGIADYTARDVVNEMQNRGILFRERAEDYEMQPESEMAVQAEEPIEDRLARAYKNGLEQGLALGHRAFGRWDHS